MGIECGLFKLKVSFGKPVSAVLSDHIYLVKATIECVDATGKGGIRGQVAVAAVPLADRQPWV